MEAPIKQLARQHLDLMFQVLCMKGFPLSLEAAALGMSLQAKTHMKSEDVPKVWASGNRQAVLDYVCDDVKVTIQLAEKIHKRKEIIWKSKTGKTASLKIQDLMNVTECLNIPLPDVSWMNTTQTPYERSSYVGWLEQDSHSQ